VNRSNSLFPLLAVVLAASGCAFNRVALAPLPLRDAPLPVRVKAYKAYAIQNGQQTTYLRNGVPQSTLLNFVLLGDGTRVEDARDLSPAVEPGSPTGKFIARIEAGVEGAKRASTILFIASVAVIALGLSIGIPLLLEERCTSVPATGGYLGYQTCFKPGTVPGGIAVSGAGLGALSLTNLWPFVASMAARGNMEDRTSAFMTYNQSLRARLGLDDEALEQEQDTKSRVLAPSAMLVPSASFWLAHLTR
jgi:hypothetical protein